MGFYEDMAAQAASLIREFGKDLTLQRRGQAASYDPVLGSVSGNVPQTVGVAGLLLDMNDDWRKDDEDVRVGDRLVLLTGEVEPLKGDKLLAEGKLWSIELVKPLRPAGVALIYKAKVRA